MSTEMGVWVGLRRCGCCRAVMVDNPEHQRDVERTKREWLKDGLSVVYATWHEWLDRYRPTVSGKCPHEPQAGDAA